MKELLEVFDELVTAKLNTLTLKGQYRLFKSYEEHVGSSLPGSRIKLDFILMYLKRKPQPILSRRVIQYFTK